MKIYRQIQSSWLQKLKSFISSVIILIFLPLPTPFCWAYQVVGEHNASLLILILRRISILYLYTCPPRSYCNSTCLQTLARTWPLLMITVLTFLAHICGIFCRLSDPSFWVNMQLTIFLEMIHFIWTVLTLPTPNPNQPSPRPHRMCTHTPNSGRPPPPTDSTHTLVDSLVVVNLP